MTDPVSLTSATPRFSLPYLFAAQAQKEVFVNEALFLADMLLHPAVVSETSTPPTTPAEGACWLVGTDPSGAWVGYAGSIAAFHAGAWTFVPPREGMTLLVEATGQTLRYNNGWQAAAQVAAPAGGSVIDSEARTAINALRLALIAAGILPQA
jgi:hypothetical protein